MLVKITLFTKTHRMKKSNATICKNILPTHLSTLILGCETLLNICSNYIIKNQDSLNSMYKTKSKQLWDLINSNQFEGEDKKIICSVMAEVSRKQKLLRLVDCEDVPASVLYEEYGESDIFLKENHVYDIVNGEPLVISNELKRSVSNFVSC